MNTCAHTHIHKDAEWQQGAVSRVTLQVRGHIWAKTADVGRHRWQVKGQGLLVAEVHWLWGTGLG